MAYRGSIPRRGFRVATDRRDTMQDQKSKDEAVEEFFDLLDEAYDHTIEATSKGTQQCDVSPALHHAKKARDKFDEAIQKADSNNLQE